MTVQSTEKFEEGQDVKVAVPHSSEQPTRKNLARLSRSVAVLLAVILLSGYALAYQYYPWRDLAKQDIPEWIISYAGDCADYCLKGQKSDVAVLGTSLILAVNQHCAKTAINTRELKSNNVAEPLKKKLMALRGSHREVSISLLAVPASMITDQLLILEKLIEYKKKPDLLVVTVAPRDFIDNMNSDVRKSPVARVFMFLSKNKNFLPSSFAPEKLESCLSGHLTYIGLLRTDCLRKLKREACRLTGHPDSLWTALNTDFKQDLAQKSIEPSMDGNVHRETEQAKTPAQFERSNNANLLDEDLILYKSRYLPINRERILLQLAAYDQLLRITQQEKIRALVLFMPVSKPNSDLLPPAVLDELKSHVFARAKEGGVNAYDLEQEVIKETGSPLVLDDFVDSVHVNKAGAEKLIGPISNLTAQEVKALAKAH